MNKYIAILIAFLLVGAVLGSAQNTTTVTDANVTTVTPSTDANVTTVAPTDANVTTVAPSTDANVTTVAPSTDANVTTVAPTDANVTTVTPSTDANVTTTVTDAPITTTEAPTTTAAPVYEVKVTSAPNVTQEDFVAAIKSYGGYNIVVNGVPVLKASRVGDDTLTATADFDTNETRAYFVQEVNNGNVQGVATAEVVNPTNAPATAAPEGGKNHAGLIAGVVIGVVALIAIIVGVVVYRRRRVGGDYDNIDMRQNPQVPNKESAFV